MTNWNITAIIPTTSRRFAISCLRCSYHTVEHCPTEEDLRAVLNAHDTAAHGKVFAS